jgi:hypothetical protein
MGRVERTLKSQCQEQLRKERGGLRGDQKMATIAATVALSGFKAVRTADRAAKSKC